MASLRGPDGGPALRVRLLAIIVALGMLGISAPLILIPVVRWVASALF